MKKIIDEHLEKVLLGIALFLMLVLVLIYAWGVRGLGGVMAKATAVGETKMVDKVFNIEGAKEVLRMRGLEQ